MTAESPWSTRPTAAWPWTNRSNSPAVPANWNSAKTTPWTSEGSGSDSPTDLRAAESDFTLSTLEEEEDDSDSGSQVIAIEDEETGSGFGGSGSMPPMLDGEDFGGDAGIAAGGGLGDFDAGGLDAGPVAQPQAAASVDYSLPEAPYSIWNILSLSFCVLFMALAAMMSYDLLRNMWSWDKPYALNSSLIDMICGMLGS